MAPCGAPCHVSTRLQPGHNPWGRGARAASREVGGGCGFTAPNLRMDKPAAPATMATPPATPLRLGSREAPTESNRKGCGWHAWKSSQAGWCVWLADFWKDGGSSQTHTPPLSNPPVNIWDLLGLCPPRRRTTAAEHARLGLGHHRMVGEGVLKVQASCWDSLACLHLYWELYCWSTPPLTLAGTTLT